MKILLLTEIYPSPTHGTKNETVICHYFAKEWTKLGHEVKAVRFNPLLPWYYVLFGRFLHLFYKKKNWSVTFLNTYRKTESYQYEGIQVVYVPMFRKRRGQILSDKEYDRAFHIANDHLMGFKPDIVVGHWGSMAPFLIKYKEMFPAAKTGIVLHEKVVGPNYLNYINRIDAWGFRNKAIKESFEEYHRLEYKGFLCNSGIPKDYVALTPKSFFNGVKRFVFAGKLMELKRVENSIMALNSVWGAENFHFDIVGDGGCMESLKSLVGKLGIDEKVSFYGWLAREKAQEIIAASDCFIMVSDHEAFGLAYLEAMAKGCITIGTIGQGADGIIENGVNGFLCSPKNLDALISLLKNIRDMKEGELNVISERAIQTAAELTDEKVAQSYLSAIIDNIS